MSRARKALLIFVNFLVCLMLDTAVLMWGLAAHWESDAFGAVMSCIGCICIGMGALILNIAALPYTAEALDGLEGPLSLKSKIVRARPDGDQVAIEKWIRREGWGPWADYYLHESQRFDPTEQAEEARDYVARLTETITPKQIDPAAKALAKSINKNL